MVGERIEQLVHQSARRIHEIEGQGLPFGCPVSNHKIIVELVGREWRLPVHFERKYLAQIFLCCERQSQGFRQYAMLRQKKDGISTVLWQGLLCISRRI